MKRRTLVESANVFLMEDVATTQSGKKLLVKYVFKDITEDTYESGEIGKRATLFEDKVGKTFKTFDEFKKWVIKDYGFRDDNDAWIVIDNRIIYQDLEDQDGNIILPKSSSFEEFKKGEIRAYNAEYDFIVSIIEESEEENDIRVFTGIEN